MATPIWPTSNFKACNGIIFSPSIWIHQGFVDMVDEHSEVVYFVTIGLIRVEVPHCLTVRPLDHRTGSCAIDPQKRVVVCHLICGSRDVISGNPGLEARVRQARALMMMLDARLHTSKSYYFPLGAYKHARL